MPKSTGSYSYTFCSIPFQWNNSKQGVRGSPERDVYVI